MAEKRKKVLVFSRHKDEFTEARINQILKKEGKRVEIHYEEKMRFEGDRNQKISECVAYFKDMVKAGYVPYLILPKYLKEALLQNGITFFVPLEPEKVKYGIKTSILEYSPNLKKPLKVSVNLTVTAKIPKSRYRNRKH